VTEDICSQNKRFSKQKTLYIVEASRANTKTTTSHKQTVSCKFMYHCKWSIQLLIIHIKSCSLQAIPCIFVHCLNGHGYTCACFKYYSHTEWWGVGGTLIELTPFVRRVMGSTPALAAT